MNDDGNNINNTDNGDSGDDKEVMFSGIINMKDYLESSAQKEDKKIEDDYPEIEGLTREEITDLVSEYVDLSDNNPDKQDQIKCTVEFIASLESCDLCYQKAFEEHGKGVAAYLHLDLDLIDRVMQEHRQSTYVPSEFIGLRVALFPTEYEEAHIDDYKEIIANSRLSFAHNNPYLPEWWSVPIKEVDENGEYNIKIMFNEMPDIYIAELFLDYVAQYEFTSNIFKSMADFFSQTIWPTLIIGENAMHTLMELIMAFDKGII